MILEYLVKKASGQEDELIDLDDKPVSTAPWTAIAAAALQARREFLNSKVTGHKSTPKMIGSVLSRGISGYGTGSMVDKLINLSKKTTAPEYPYNNPNRDIAFKIMTPVGAAIGVANALRSKKGPKGTFVNVYRGTTFGAGVGHLIDQMLYKAQLNKLRREGVTPPPPPPKPSDEINQIEESDPLLERIRKEFEPLKRKPKIPTSVIAGLGAGIPAGILGGLTASVKSKGKKEKLKDFITGALVSGGLTGGLAAYWGHKEDKERPKDIEWAIRETYKMEKEKEKEKANKQGR